MPVVPVDQSIRHSRLQPRSCLQFRRLLATILSGLGGNAPTGHGRHEFIRWLTKLDRRLEPIFKTGTDQGSAISTSKAFPLSDCRPPPNPKSNPMNFHNERTTRSFHVKFRPKAIINLNSGSSEAI